MNKEKSKSLEIFSRYGVFLILLILFLFFSCIADSFLTLQNILNVSRQISMIGICSAGITFVLITGGIDISIGSVIAFTGVIASILMTSFGLPIPVVIAMSMGLGLFLGAFNGYVITRFAIPPLIATLAMQTMARGGAYILTQGIPVYGVPEGFAIIGQGYLFGIPVPVYIMALVFFAGFWVLEKTYLGRHVYATGGNEEAARLSGINVRKVKLLVYMLNSFLAALSGIIMLSRINSGQPGVGVNFEMDVITAAVLGGVSVNGGEGRIFNVVAGVFIMGILSNGMVLVNLNEYWQWIAKGAVLVLAVAIDNVQKRKLKQ